MVPPETARVVLAGAGLFLFDRRRDDSVDHDWDGSESTAEGTAYVDSDEAESTAEGTVLMTTIGRG